MMVLKGISKLPGVDFQVNHVKLQGCTLHGSTMCLPAKLVRIIFEIEIVFIESFFITGNTRILNGVILDLHINPSPSDDFPKHIRKNKVNSQTKSYVFIRYSPYIRLGMGGKINSETPKLHRHSGVCSHLSHHFHLDLHRRRKRNNWGHRGWKTSPKKKHVEMEYLTFVWGEYIYMCIYIVYTYLNYTDF